jgi:cytochrome c oxidase cbb3-type subunit 3
MAKQPIKSRKLWALAALLCFCIATAAAASDSRKSVRAALDKPAVRGGIVFKNYCVLCHGETGDGQSRAKKLYPDKQLKIRRLNDDHYEAVIRNGGTAKGLSPFMPPWEDELSEEQINDVITYLGIVTNAIKRGEVVYKTNCILCHGLKGDGKGRAAKLFNPPPADLTHSDKNDDYKAMIIRLGGKAMGRSEVMPSWESQLSQQEIADLVKYLRSILVADNLAANQ